MTTTRPHPPTHPGTTEAADPDEVAERLVGILNDGAIAVLASLGHELGLFETLARCRPPPATRSPTRPGSTSATSASGSAGW